MSPNTPILYTTPITIDTVSLNNILGVLLSLTVSNISLAFFLALLAIFLLISSSLSYMRTSNLLENFLKVKFVLSIMLVN